MRDEKALYKRRDGMNITFGKWQYKVSRKGVELVSYNIYANSWVRIIK